MSRGEASADKLGALSQDVVIDTRDVEGTLAKTTPDDRGDPPFKEWWDARPAVRLLPFPEARFVKALDSVVPSLMADRSRIPTKHIVFVVGGGTKAKATVASVLQVIG